MSADGDTVRAALESAFGDWEAALAALARLEAAEASCLYQFGRANDAEDAAHEHEVAAVHFAEKLTTAEAQRDALAEALRGLADAVGDSAEFVAINARVVEAYAALTEAGLE